MDTDRGRLFYFRRPSYTHSYESQRRREVAWHTSDVHRCKVERINIGQLFPCTLRHAVWSVFACPRHSHKAARKSSIDSSTGQKFPSRSCGSRGKVRPCATISSAAVG